MMTTPEVVLHLVDDLPKEQIAHLSEILRDETRLDWERLSFLMCTAIPQIDIQERVRHFIAEWQNLSQQPTPAEMSLLLQSVSTALTHQREKQKIELIWTGPRSPHVSLRRTDQALIELINSAQERLLIVSFVVYKARSILSVLEKAANRGVENMLILESPEVDEGKIAYSTIAALGASLRARSKVFIWPHAKRATTPEGKTGSLHAKIGVADGIRLYLSSANLTDYAMNLNMEMGLLVENREIATSVEQHFKSLIDQQILVEIPRDER